MLALLKRHGWNATSFQILEPGFRYWFDGDDACVGVRRHRAARGSPRARRSRPPSGSAEVAARFVAGGARGGPARRASSPPSARFRDAHRLARAAHRRAAGVGSGALGRARARRAAACASSSGARAPRACACARVDAERARRRGRRCARQLEALIARWLRDAADGADGLPRPGAAVRVRRRAPLLRRRARRRGGRLPRRRCRSMRAAAGSSRTSCAIPTRRTAPPSCSSTPAMRAAARGGQPLRHARAWCRSPGPVEPAGCARRAGCRRALYDFDGLRAFKAKLRPDAWEPIYLAHPPRHARATSRSSTRSPRSRAAASCASASRRCLRGPALVVRAAGGAAGAVDGAARARRPRAGFPSPWVQWGWVAFDVVLVVALFALTAALAPLARRRRSRPPSAPTRVADDDAGRALRRAARARPRLDRRRRARRAGAGRGRPVGRRRSSSRRAVKKPDSADRGVSFPDGRRQRRRVRRDATAGTIDAVAWGFDLTHGASDAHS